MKLMELFVDLRDFCYIRARKKYDERYAEKEHKFYLKVLLAPYYMALLVVFSLLVHKSGNNLNFVEDDSMNIVVVMTPLVVIYIIIFNYIYSKTKTIPIDKEMEEKKYKNLTLKSNIVLISGILLFVLAPFLVPYIL